MYAIKRGDTLSRIAGRHGVTLKALLSADPQYEANPNAINVGDKLEIPGERPVAAKKATKKKSTKKKVSRRPAQAASAVADVEDDFTVPLGQLTFDAEGLEKSGR